MEAVGIAKLDEVLSGVRALDACIREVLHAQHELVLAAGSEVEPQSEVTAEVETCREALAFGLVDRCGHVCADPTFHEPGRCPLRYGDLREEGQAAGPQPPDHAVCRLQL